MPALLISTCCLGPSESLGRSHVKATVGECCYFPVHTEDAVESTPCLSGDLLYLLERILQFQSSKVDCNVSPSRPTSVTECKSVLIVMQVPSLRESIPAMCFTLPFTSVFFHRVGSTMKLILKQEVCQALLELKGRGCDP